MLEDFGIFLVLADKVKSPFYPTYTWIYLLFLKSLFAYHIEALVPSSPNSANTSQTPQKLNGSKDVHFFSVGSLGGRTLVIYMKKKGVSCSPIALTYQADLTCVVSSIVFSAYSSPLLARSTRGQRLLCLSALDLVCGNLGQSGSASTEYAYLVSSPRKIAWLTPSYRTSSYRQSHTTSFS
jgi:hypothetical protein